jgi:hypothetical protein
LRAVAFDRVSIGRIRTHVNPALPCALERIGDLQRHPTDVLDFNIHTLAILQRTDTTWEVDWSETTFTDGARSGVARYTGLFSVDAVPPSNQAELLANPLGFHLNSITWSREGASP